MSPSPWRLLGAAWAFGALLPAAATTVAVDPQPESRITQVKVYPGSATVERMARVAPGLRTLKFFCLPAGLDPQSIRVTAPASVRVGETSVLTQPRAHDGACASHPLDARIAIMETHKDHLQSEHEALGLVTGYLKRVASPPGDAAPAGRARTGKELTEVTGALRRSAQDALLRQRQIARELADTDLELAPLVAERARARGKSDRVVTVAVTLSTAANAGEVEVRLSYQVPGPTWTPTYRALLDTPSRRVRLERLALVSQATGEDWGGVKMLLSTGQPRQETAGRLPSPWRLGMAPPVVVQKLSASLMARMDMGIPVPAAAPVSTSEGAEPSFEVAQITGGFATEFSVPQAIDVPSSGQRVALALGQHDDVARLAARTTPHLDPTAFLVADLPTPPGVWPDGALQLYRDGAYVGQGQWPSAGGPRLSLSFGRDELVRVAVAPPQDSEGTGGLTGSRTEHRMQRRYTIENRHSTPMAVQVLEAAPVPVDDQVKVTVRFTPQPADLAWEQQPGVAMWSLDLAAGQTARVSADYLIAHPKDGQLQSR